jgi:hypothetical protein
MSDHSAPSPGGPTAEPVMAMTVEKCGRCRGTSIDAVTEGPCTFNFTGGYWYTEEQLHGRDALVMDWARKQLAHRAYVDSLMVGRITQEQWVENRRLVAIVTEAFTALAAFDARPAEGDENA